MLASAYGLQYELPQEQVGAVGAQPRGQVSQDMYGEGNLLDSDLYVKEGMTDEYYKKVAALKSFANEVSSRYGFDVTRPNYRNPESIRFHKSYLQALADLQMTKNQLKRSATHENAALLNPNIRVREGANGQDYFVNEGENDVVKAMRTTAGSIKSREGAADFQAARDTLIEQLQDELSSSENPKERDQIGSTITQLKALRPDVGISDAAQGQLDFMGENLDETIRHNKETEKIGWANANRERGGLGGMTPTQQTMLLGRIKTIGQLSNPEALNTMGFTREDRSSGTYLTKTVKGEKKSVHINPKDPLGTLRNINEIMNEGEGTSVSYDLLQAAPLDLMAMGEAVIGKVSPVDDVFTSFMEKFDTTVKDAQSKPEIRQVLSKSLTSSKAEVPSSVFSTFPNGKSSDSEIVSVKEGTSKLGFGSPYIEIFAKEKGDRNAKPKSKMFYLNDAEDVELLREIFEGNKRNLNIPNLPNQGTIVAPSSGVGLDLDKL